MEANAFFFFLTVLHTNTHTHHFIILMFENNSFYIIIYSCYRRYLTLSPPCYFYVSKITFYFGIPLGNNRLALLLLFIQKLKTNMFFLFLAPIQHSTIYLLCDLTKL